VTAEAFAVTFLGVALDAAAAGFRTRVLLGLTAAVAPDRVGDTLAAWEAAGVTTEGDLPT